MFFSQNWLGGSPIVRLSGTLDTVSVLHSRYYFVVEVSCSQCIMATTAKTTPQDLPPKGGYAPFTTERTRLRTLISGRTAILSYFAITTGGLYLYFQNYKYNRKHHVEMRSARIAMYPVLLAERDREFLKQLSRNRKDEAELTKDVPGWEVGTLYGEPIFKTVGKDILTEPTFREYYIHASPKEHDLRADISLWT